jgi:hypothetical protein
MGSIVPVRRYIILLAVVQFSCAFAQVAEEPVIRYESLRHPQYSTTGMVAAQNAIAAEIGAQVLADGGNAVDAAVAVGFSLAVVLPRAGNIGGGGFMLIHDAASGDDTAIDYREMAPPGATRDMFLDADGDADPNLSRRSHKASGVPGTVAGLYLAHEKFGRLPWKRLVQPAVALARDGIVVTRDLSTSLKERRDFMCRNEATCRYFYKDGGVPYEMGERLVQSDLDQYGRIGGLQASCPRAATRRVSRLRNSHHAAAEFRWCAHHPDAQYPRALSGCRDGRGQRGQRSPVSRGHATRLRRPQQAPGRSGFLPGSDRVADEQCLWYRAGQND